MKLGRLFCLLTVLLSGCRDLGLLNPPIIDTDRRPPWQPYYGSEVYTNPILFADYSDPDVVRVGDYFYLTSSSFNCVPGLPILRSRDLLSWTIIGHALPKLVPEEHYNKVQIGGGVWAPSIRFHAGKFYIFYPDPDYGIYMVTATDPAGEWSAPVLVKAGRGLEDPCPLWDDDGKVYLVHALVASRIGRNNALVLNQLSPDATKTIDDGHDIIAGTQFGITGLEGPKFYKLNGYYWIFAPVGGVTGGTQAVFRSKSIEGPYEMRIVLAQGKTKVNGPHQGALVNMPDGKEWWFIHFQDAGVYGRIDHLEPVKWKADGWPVIGNDPDNSGTGEPVTTLTRPIITLKMFENQLQDYAPKISDNFNGPNLGLQWQWQANPQDNWYSLSTNPDHLRLYSQPANPNFVRQPNLLLQKLSGPNCDVSTIMTFFPAEIGERAGVVVWGNPCYWAGLVKTADGLRLSICVCRVSASGDVTIESELKGSRATSNNVHFNLDLGGTGENGYLRVEEVGKPGIESYFAFTAIHGSWIGAKFGLFAIRPATSKTTGYADFEGVQLSQGTN